MQPSGLVGLIGVSMQSLFFKDLLAKIGVQAQIFNYHEYKNAGNMFTESSYTDAHREQSQRLTDGMFELVCCCHSTLSRFLTRLCGKAKHPPLTMPFPPNAPRARRQFPT